MTARGPQPLKGVLSELITLRGWARPRGQSQLLEVWREIAGAEFARHSRPRAVKNGVLHVAVSNAPLLSQLAAFHKQSLLESLQSRHAELRIRDIKFKLDADIQAP